MKSPDIFKFKGRASLILLGTALVSLLGFIWPFFASSQSQAHLAQYFFLAALPLSLLLLASEISSSALDSKTIALLAILSALIAALRPIGAGAIGIEPMWFILILSSYVFGSSFGFLLGAISMFVSALITGGIGPWLSYQIFAAALIGALAGSLPKYKSRSLQILTLVIYAIFAAELFGILMDLQFWPWALGTSTQLSFIPGASVTTNLTRFFAFHFATALAWDIPRAIFTSILILLSASPILSALRRAHRKAAFVTDISFGEIATLRAKEGTAGQQ